MRAGTGRCAVVLAMITVCARLAAQDAAVVIYAEGDSVAVVGATGREIQLEASDAVGYQLRIGDTVVTEHGTFLEIQLLPSDSIVKIAENTNFTIERRDSPRGGTFNLVYGKVRARVAVLAQKEEFVIRSGSAIAGVRGTDFGVTAVIPGLEAAPTRETVRIAETPSITQVYCFDGAVEVSAVPPVSDLPVPEAAPVVVRENQVVTVLPEATSVPAAVELPVEIREFWEANDFRAQPLPVSADIRIEAPAAAGGATVVPASTSASTSAAEPTAEPTAEPPRTEPAATPAVSAEAAATPSVVTPVEVLVQRAEKGRFSFRAVSVLMLALAAGFEVAGFVDALVPGTDIFGDNGVGMIGVGGVFLLGGIFSTFQAARLDQTIRDLGRREAP